MERKSLVVLAVVGIALMSAGCLSQSGGGVDTVDSSNSGVNLQVDREAEVVCFAPSANVDAGIDCMPVSETQFDSMSEVPESEGSITRDVREEAGVVCYLQSMNVDAGIDCLPMNKTAL